MKKFHIPDDEKRSVWIAYIDSQDLAEGVGIAVAGLTGGSNISQFIHQKSGKCLSKKLIQ